MAHRRFEGAPFTYACTAKTLRGLPLLDPPAMVAVVEAELDRVAMACDLRLFSRQLHADRLELVLRLPDRVLDPDHRLIDRWLTHCGSRPDPAQLRRRLSSLGGIMQLLLQRISRAVNRQRQEHGSLWQARFQACLLADDAAILAAWVRQGAPDRPTSPAGEACWSDPPIRAAPDGGAVPADTAPLALPPPGPLQLARLLQAFRDAIPAEDVATYGEALDRSWCLGRPESLTEALAELGRDSGRGRSRRLRDLDDQLGLCAVWG